MGYFIKVGTKNTIVNTNYVKFIEASQEEVRKESNDLESEDQFIIIFYFLENDNLILEYDNQEDRDYEYSEILDKLT